MKFHIFLKLLKTCLKIQNAGLNVCSGQLPWVHWWQVLWACFAAVAACGLASRTLARHGSSLAHLIHCWCSDLQVHDQSSLFFLQPQKLGQALFKFSPCELGTFFFPLAWAPSFFLPYDRHRLWNLGLPSGRVEARPAQPKTFTQAFAKSLLHLLLFSWTVQQSTQISIWL